MPTIHPYRLTFHSGLHIGTRGVNLEEGGQTIPSDTLFAALLDAWQRRGGGARTGNAKLGVAEVFAQPFLSQPPNPPFLLSSAFPFVGEVLFFPMPLDLRQLFGPKIMQGRSKEIRRIRYLSQGLFQKALQGKVLDDDLFPEDEWAEPERGAALHNGTLWFHLDEMDAFPAEFKREARKRHALRALPAWSAGRLPRVTVSRITSASNLFHAGRVVFARGCGLWFGVEWRSPDLKVEPGGLSYAQAFEQALAMLQDDGLGGERSSGYGSFKAAAGKPLEFRAEVVPGELSFLLSRYHPGEAELPAALNGSPSTAYSLVAVSGWLRSPEGPAQRRKRLFMVSEGSLITPPRYPTGEVCDVRPTYQNPAGDLAHPVYRCGLALAVVWPDSQGRS